MELSGKVAVITGASRGIGRALSFELARCGCNLLLTALEEHELRLVLSQIKEGFSVSAEARAADLSLLEQRESILSWIKCRQELPDILINNAGVGCFGLFEGVSIKEMERTVALNINSLVNLIYGLLPVLKSRRQAAIVNISSGMSRLPYPGLAVYGATKAFVSSLSQSLDAELAGTTINVLCFHPGFTNTSFMDTAGMDIKRLPRILLATPEKTAIRVRKAIQQNKHWEYSDALTQVSVLLGQSLPIQMKRFISNRLFRRLAPNAK